MKTLIMTNALTFCVSALLFVIPITVGVAKGNIIFVKAEPIISPQYTNEDVPVTDMGAASAEKAR